MMTFFTVIGIIFCLLFLGVIGFGAFLSIAAYVEERHTDKRNREEGNLKITADKACRFKKN